MPLCGYSLFMQKLLGIVTALDSTFNNGLKGPSIANSDLQMEYWFLDVLSMCL